MRQGLQSARWSEDEGHQLPAVLNTRVDLFDTFLSLWFGPKARSKGAMVTGGG